MCVVYLLTKIIWTMCENIHTQYSLFLKTVEIVVASAFIFVHT